MEAINWLCQSFRDPMAEKPVQRGINKPYPPAIFTL
jgi:hypothetical protein